MAVSESIGALMRVALASTSPRRREIIRALDIEVDCIVSCFDEGLPESGERPEDYVTRMAVGKACNALNSKAYDLVIGADTTVSIDETILAKPVDSDDARRMLRFLRGRTHIVTTAIAVLERRTGACRSAFSQTDVHIRALTEDEISRYVASGEVFDKAGAYAVQDTVYRPASGVTGCYLNAVGLPLCELTRLLRSFGLACGTSNGFEFPRECQGCPLMNGSRRGAA
jgi:MAF protein